MRVKKIQAKTFSEALALVKRELGKDAVILSSEDKKGSRAYVEITAAIDYDIGTNNNTYHAQISPVNDMGGFMEIKKEIKSLRETLETMKNSGYEITLPGERKKMFYFLKERSIKEDFALKLVERAKDINDLEMLMSKDMDKSRFLGNSVRVDSPRYESIPTGESQRQGKRIVMLIGPTGVGKTTTIAKLAAKAIKDRKKIALIGLDTYKIGAIEQIRIYSRMMGISLDIVSDPDNLKKSINRFSDRDLLFIDTTGQNPKDDGYIRGLKDVYKTGLSIETQLLLSTSSDCDFLMETYKYYRSLPVDCIAFTKTDEAVKLGLIYNLCLLYQKPVAYITTGQQVPGNIEFVDSKKLTELVLRTGRT